MRRVALAALLSAGLVACGGSGPTDPPPVTAPATPAAAITGSGGGALVLHPSSNRSYFFALETPVRIQETAGGSADWTFARFSILRAGREIERGEIGSDVIQARGWGKINARSNDVYNITFRFNSEDFDTVSVTLGFTDLKDSRQFTVQIPETAFPSVNISLTPLNLPSDRVDKL